jgi:transcriptional regulator with XRE-family HTH domain
MSEQIKEIAARVRALREIEGLSPETLARELRIETAAYEKYETGNSDIPVGLLAEIANKFNVDLSELVTGKSPRLTMYNLTRKDRGPVVERRAPYRYRSLAHNFIHRKAEPFLVEVGPESENRPLDLNTHPGQEFDYVVEGRLLVSVGGHEIELNEGDSLYYDSGEPHGMKALGGASARFLAIIL